MTLVLLLYYQKKPKIKNPNVLEGTLAYLSPEQTGRMNRGIDYRSDFYSLGVTFYELLQENYPFSQMTQWNWFIVILPKHPPLGHQINPRNSACSVEIVMKLMAKNAEDRYQSALGLKFDLENCLNQLQETGKIQTFQIAVGCVRSLPHSRKTLWT